MILKLVNFKFMLLNVSKLVGAFPYITIFHLIYRRQKSMNMKLGNFKMIFYVQKKKNMKTENSLWICMIIGTKISFGFEIWYKIEFSLLLAVKKVQISLSYWYGHIHYVTLTTDRKPYIWASYAFKVLKII